MIFHDRTSAGRALARRLRPYAARPDVLVLALPRGGVPVAYEVARALRAPLDVFLVRKLGVPGQEELAMGAIATGGVPVAHEVAAALGAPLDVFVTRKLGVPGQEELAMGAVASGGVRVLNELVLAETGVSERQLEAVTRGELAELGRQERAYRGMRPGPQLRDRVVILVDDGLATGASMTAAVRALRPLGPSRIVVAVPAAPAEACAQLTTLADEVVCLLTPRPFLSVGQWYEEFGQTTDEEVRRLLG